MKQDKTFAEKAVEYFYNLKIPGKLPPGMEVLNPYDSPEVKNTVKEFYTKYYSDKRKRIYILGINPGRFGGGLTGISFTDPVALRVHCGIQNSFSDKKELSSEFIYYVIGAYGGPEKFFAEFFLSALYPLAIIRNGKNYNYYDDPWAYGFFRESIRESLKQQSSFGTKGDSAICLGIKNYKYLKIFNDELGLFRNIAVLDHPRYIMQYKRKRLEEYIETYLRTLNNQ